METISAQPIYTIEELAEWNKAIDYLIDHYFPLRNQAALSSVRNSEGNKTYIENLENYKAHILSLSRSQVIQRANDLELEVNNKARIDKENWIRNLPHNSTAAKADFSYWGKMDLWDCLEEGALLCLGINPQLFPWKTLEKYRYEDPKIASLFRIRDLISRAIDANEELPAKANPSKFIDWINKKHIEFPVELEKEVKKYSVSKIDICASISTQEHYENELSKYKTRITDLEVEIKQNTLTTKERNTAYKIIFGFLQTIYGANLNSENSIKEAIGQAIKDFTQFESSPHEDTLFNWFSAAIEWNRSKKLKQS
jgi:hypothetical protein